MSAAQQSLNAVKAALQNAEARSEGSVARGQGEQPFVCATVGLRINDLKSVVSQCEEMSKVVAENARLQAERDELDAEMTRCHRLIDKAAGEDAETTSIDTLEDRLGPWLERFLKDGEIAVLKSDYERLIASLPVGPRAVR